MHHEMPVVFPLVLSLQPLCKCYYVTDVKKRKKKELIN